MPVYSEITITFTNDWVEGDLLAIISKTGTTFDTESWTWVNTRSAGFEVTTGTPTATAGERAALNFKTAFDLDNPTGYTTSVTTNSILIQSETLGEDFLLVYTNSGQTGEIGNSISNYIENASSYKAKYYISYCDDFTSERNVFILKKGHTGGAVELLADKNPISISYESSSDFKFSPIRPSTAEVFMIFDSEGTVDFEEFWTADEKDYKVQDIKEGVVEWVGYVIPNGFQYEFKGGFYYASIIASDGLSSLEALTFISDNLKPYGNQDLVYNDGFLFEPILIATEILKKLDLDLDLWTCVDAYEQTMTKTGDTRDADPLTQCYFNTKTYIKEGEDEDIPYWYGSGEEWNCKEVMENLLYVFGAKLYQETGVWRIKSINADIDFGSGATQRYWRKYNTVATYLADYEIVNDERNIPCNDITKLMIGNDHVMYMDDVYKAFRINYKYTFLRDGDSPVNLIENGDFLLFNDISVFSAPIGWRRAVLSFGLDAIRIRSIDISPISDDVGGYTRAVELGKQSPVAPLTGTTPIMDWRRGMVQQLGREVKNNDRLFFEIWNKHKYYLQYVVNGRTYRGNSTMMYRMVLLADDGSKYFLRNGPSDVDDGFVWEKSIDSTADIFIETTCFYLEAERAQNYNSANDATAFWYNHKYTLPNSPATGFIYFMVHGIAVDYTVRGQFPGEWPAYTLSQGVYQRTGLWKVLLNTPDQYSTLVWPAVTGVQLSIIPSGEDIPEQQDYIYNNTNTNYTLQVDPITIYNGDVQNSKHISNITVKTNTTGSKNFWDDLGETYGSSSLGLLVCRQIMRQYQLPYRVLEGTIKIQDARFGSVYTFSVLPGIRFVLLRGTINKQKQYIENATFVQLSSDVLPDGGSEGGNTLTPQWQFTGNSYCRTIDGINDGFVIREEQDINPNSESYGDTREVVSDAQDLDQCPLSQPRLYYWGSDDEYLNTDTLTFSPFTEIDSKEIQISLNNDEGNYLYFVHLKTLGVVERIYTLTSPNNVLSDWVYLQDVIIDGYLYRVLRTDYTMSAFTDFRHNFRFA